MVRKAAFLQGSDPLDISKVQAPAHRHLHHCQTSECPHIRRCLSSGERLPGGGVEAGQLVEDVNLHGSDLTKLVSSMNKFL